MSVAPTATFKSPASLAPKNGKTPDVKPGDIHFVEISDELVPHVTPGRSKRSAGQMKLDAKVRVNLARWHEAGKPGRDTPWLRCPLDAVTVPHEVAEHTRYMIRKSCDLIGGKHCKPRFGRYNASVDEIPDYVLSTLSEADTHALQEGHDLIAFTVYVEAS